MTVIMYLGLFYGIYIISVYKLYASKYLSDYTLTLAGMVACISNGSSRIILREMFSAFITRLNRKRFSISSAPHSKL